MIAIYLWFNAVAYAFLGLWCALRLETTARHVGFVGLSDSGRVEYLAVYGGLQWGLALVFALFALKPELHRTGLLAAMLFYVPIVVHRVIGLLRFGPVESTTKVLATLEIALLLAAIALWWLQSTTQRVT